MAALRLGLRCAALPALRTRQRGIGDAPRTTRENHSMCCGLPHPITPAAAHCLTTVAPMPLGRSHQRLSPVPHAPGAGPRRAGSYVQISAYSKVCPTEVGDVCTGPTPPRRPRWGDRAAHPQGGLISALVALASITTAAHEVAALLVEVRHERTHHLTTSNSAS
ncbi:MAG: hypothetical protein HC876_23000 [Chloroflexaceae bacterium]|nr:hypothetical protein [Chloroflexaceae bacterium]